MIKYSFLFIQLFVITIVAKTQVKYFVQADGNLSVLSNKVYKGTYTTQRGQGPIFLNIRNDANFETKMGLGINAGAIFPINEKLSVETYLKGSLVRFRQKNNFTLYNDANPSGFFESGPLYAVGIGPKVDEWSSLSPYLISLIKEHKEDNGTANIMYASINGKFLYRLLPKTIIGVGIGVHTLINAKNYYVKFKRRGDDPNFIPGFFQERDEIIGVSIEKGRANEKFNKIGLQASLSVEQKITENFSLVAEAVQHANTLFKEKEIIINDNEPRMRYISLGLRYYLK